MELNKVYCGDCVEIAKKIPDNTVDFILTDPPFNVSYKYGEYKDNLTDEQYRDWCIDWLKEGFRILKDRHFAIIFTSDKKLYYLLDACYKAGFNYLHLLKWYKKNSNRINYGTCLFSLIENGIVVSKNKASKKLINFNMLAHDTIECNNISARNLEAVNHPAQRPVNLYTKIIEGFTKENDIVYDFFMGSGTTAEASIKTNRNYLGSEMDSNYIKVIEERLSNVDIITGIRIF